jgi:hypothetical protein
VLLVLVLVAYVIATHVKQFFFSVARAPTNGLLRKLGLYPNCLQYSPLFHFCGWNWLAANFATIRGMRTDDVLLDVIDMCLL